MKKGKLYYGSTGVGKTTLLKREFNNLENSLDSHMVGFNKQWLTADDLVDAAISGGIPAIKRIANSGIVNVFLDDIGHESTTVSHFGTVFCPVAEFVKARYKATVDCDRLPMTTHFTTNLDAKALAATYGNYIVDRLVEMCSWNLMEGKSWRV